MSVEPLVRYNTSVTHIMKPSRPRTDGQTIPLSAKTAQTLFHISCSEEILYYCRRICVVLNSTSYVFKCVDSYLKERCVLARAPQLVFDEKLKLFSSDLECLKSCRVRENFSFFSSCLAE